MIKCIRRIQFCAGHRVLGHEGKCANPHGHQYGLEVVAVSEGLDSLGRVIDFSVLKDRIGSWIDENFDHGFLVNEQDLELYAALSSVKPNKIYVCKFNPTAENIAKFLLEEVCPVLMTGTGVNVIAITLHETPNCFVEVTNANDSGGEILG